VQALEAQHLESVGVIAGGVAHDFSNLLSVILGNVDLVAHELEPKHAAAPFLEQVGEAAERAADLTRELLALAGRGALEIRPLDLSAEIAHLADLLRASIPKTMRVQLDLAENLPATAADAAQLQQLLMNLVINAAEAYAGSSGTIFVTTERVEIDEATRERRFSDSALEPGPAVVLTVRDEGCGMDDDTRGRLFEPFFTTKPAGRGLGLSAVMGIVRAYGAALEIESAPGEGSTFRVFLPATAAPARADASALPEDLTGSGVVLVVDDEPALRSAAHKMLNTLGYDVIEAADGAEACSVFGQCGQEIAVVLLDLTMPVMGGEEACRRMLGADPSVRVIIMSGYHKTEIAESLTATGRVLALRKPFSLSRLGAVVKAAFGA
jgi:CheY-like chemotaxis protein/two-component sensor histidine kinase